MHGQYREGASGLTPGYVHNIANAVLQAMKMVCNCTLYVDNQGVVTNLQKIFTANIIVSRGPGAFQVVKVKSRQDASAAPKSTLAWITQGGLPGQTTLVGVCAG